MELFLPIRLGPSLLGLGIAALPSCSADPDYAHTPPVRLIGGGPLPVQSMPVSAPRSAWLDPEVSVAPTDHFYGEPLPALEPHVTGEEAINLEGYPISYSQELRVAPQPQTYSSAESVAVSVQAPRPLVTRPRPDFRQRSGIGRPVLRGKEAIAPSGVPAVVRQAFSFGNHLQDKPYRLGGGHANPDYDSAYDCSGTTSYVLRNCGLMKGTRNSTGFMNYGRPGEGKYITIWAKPGHVFMTVCGLRLDTGGSSKRTGPRWKTKSRSMKGFVPRHPPGL